MGIPKTKRSGGPKTAEGKLAASGNALKTGAYASSVVIPGESREDFQRLFDEFVVGLMPKGAVEQSMVHELAVVTWKKFRLDQLEQSALTRVLQKPLRAIDIRREFYVSEEHDWLIEDLTVLTEEFISEGNEHLRFINSQSDYGISKDDFFALPTTNPPLYQLIVDMALDEFSYIDEPNPIPEQLFRLSKIFYDGSSEPFVHYAMQAIKIKVEEANYVYANLDEIQAAVTAVRDTRLLELMKGEGIMRARDELGRAFSRGLAELRKQQQWRIKMAVDVTPTPDPE